MDDKTRCCAKEKANWIGRVTIKDDCVKVNKVQFWVDFCKKKFERSMDDLLADRRVRDMLKEHLIVNQEEDLREKSCNDNLGSVCEICSNLRHVPQEKLPLLKRKNCGHVAHALCSKLLKKHAEEITSHRNGCCVLCSLMEC